MITGADIMEVVSLGALRARRRLGERPKSSCSKLCSGFCPYEYFPNAAGKRVGALHPIAQLNRHRELGLPVLLGVVRLRRTAVRLRAPP
ncbi:MAG: hypothetical protein RL385_2975 [Pseudomonadota bacterium]|jgi:hypothetical protein